MGDFPKIWFRKTNYCVYFVFCGAFVWLYQIRNFNELCIEFFMNQYRGAEKGLLVETLPYQPTLSCFFYASIGVSTERLICLEKKTQAVTTHATCSLTKTVSPWKFCFDKHSSTIIDHRGAWVNLLLLWLHCFCWTEKQEEQQTLLAERRRQDKIAPKISLQRYVSLVELLCHWSQSLLKLATLVWTCL